jgi:hypothetical protein
MTVRVHFHEMPPALVPYGSELALPRTYTASADGEDLAYRVTLEVATDGDDGPRCTRVTYEQVEGGPAVATAGVRSIPLGQLLRESVGLAAWVPQSRDGEIVGATSFVPPDELERAVREVTGGRRRWLLTDEHLSEVASVYKAHRRNAAGVRAPTAAVMEHFGVTRPTAGRWVMAARKRAASYRDRGQDDLAQAFLPPASERGGRLTPKRSGRKSS